jgi:hypothetical protein
MNLYFDHVRESVFLPGLVVVSILQLLLKKMLFHDPYQNILRGILQWRRKTNSTLNARRKREFRAKERGSGGSEWMVNY